MTPTDMEDTVRKLDRRLEAVEQILPTLATKADLERFATKADLERFATKADLERLATKDEVREAIAEARRHTDMQFEEVRDDIRRVAEGVASLATGLETNQKTLDTVVKRLDLHETLLLDLTRKRRK